MSEIVAKIAEYYPQITGFVLIGFLLGWVFYKMLSAFHHLEQKLDQSIAKLDHKIDLINERMATKEELSTVKMKLGVIEEKVDVLWKRQLRMDGGLDYGFPIVRAGE